MCNKGKKLKENLLLCFKLWSSSLQFRLLRWENTDVSEDSATSIFYLLTRQRHEEVWRSGG